jgi:hypothetical protein
MQSSLPDEKFLIKKKNLRDLKKIFFFLLKKFEGIKKIFFFLLKKLIKKKYLSDPS